jgi:hypothetical protein
MLDLVFPIHGTLISTIGIHMSLHILDSLGSIFGKWKSICLRATPLDVVFFEMMELTFPIHGPIIYVPSIQMSLHFLNSLGSHFGFPPTFLTPPLDDVFFEGVRDTK